MWSLRVRNGPLSGRSVDVESALVVGRENATLLVDDPAVSRQHARFELVGDGLRVVDLGSSNGTRVNGARIAQATRLHDGDIVEMGTTGIEVHADLGQKTQILPAPSDDVTTAVLEPAPPPATAPQKRAATPQPGTAEPAQVPPATPFQPPSGRRRRGTATRQPVPAIVTFLVIVATGVALVVYFVALVPGGR